MTLTLGSNTNYIFLFLLFLIFYAKYYSIQFLQSTKRKTNTNKKKMKQNLKFFYIYKIETDFSRYENGISLIFYKLQQNLNHIIGISFYVYH